MPSYRFANAGEDLSGNCGISTPLWFRNLDTNSDTNKKAGGVLHTDVEDGFECEVAATHNQQGAIWENSQSLNEDKAAEDGSGRSHT